MKLWSVILLAASLSSRGQEVLPGTQPLTNHGDFSAQMVAGIDQFLLHEIDISPGERQKLWQRDLSSPEAYVKSVQPNREHFRHIIGAVDARMPAKENWFASQKDLADHETRPAQSDTSKGGDAEGQAQSAKVGETDSFSVQAVRWPVFEDVFGEGLLLRPKGRERARIVAVPDADQTPEMITGLAPGLAPERQFARRLAENGCTVLVPVIIDRQDTWSGIPQLHRFTNEPHREWIYRQAFEMGRHIIGYEVQKVMAAVDCWEAASRSPTASSGESEGGGRGATNLTETRIGVAGYGEGGLIAFYAAALDPRIDGALVSGYFDSRQRVWEEPIYRNVWGLLQEFGDAEIASLIAPRALVVEYSPAPHIAGPPEPHDGRTGAAPGRLQTPDYESVEAEFDRARKLLKDGAAKNFDRFQLICGNEGMSTGPGSDRALAALLDALGAHVNQIKQPDRAPVDLRNAFDPAKRQHRQFMELQNYTQNLFRQSEQERAEFFWNKIKTASPQEWAMACAPFKQNFWEEVIGRFPSPTLPANPRSRRLEAGPLARPSREPSGPETNTIGTAAVLPAKSWTGYEVVLDVYPDVFAWGDLLMPGDLKSGERRPVVVCQHGLSAVPEDTFNEDPQSRVYAYYKGFAARLAEEGFVVFAPHNPYRVGDTFRPLQRKANPLKKSIFSIIVAQHDRILEWLATLPFVDAKRIGFYGLSYGGAAAMRVPAVLDGYALSICSGNFNDWARKNVTVDSPTSYLIRSEYEMPEFNLGNTFDYAEMAALIAPRPFMVERGRRDGIAPDEWVAGEYDKVRQFYDKLGIGERTQIEFFDGGHTINGVGTFQFLRRHLERPEH